MEKGYIVFNPSKLSDAQFEELLEFLEEIKKECLKQKSTPEAT